jgi:hypothetical protein
VNGSGFFVNFAGMRTPPAILGPGRFRLLLPAILPVIMLAGLLAACQQDEVCEELTANPLRIGFYLPSENGQAQTAIIDSLTVFGLDRPGEPIYDNRALVSRIELPLDPLADTCGFVLIFPEQTDTLILTYQRELSLLSVECGFAMFFELEQVWSTGNVIMVIEKNNHTVSNSQDEHLKVFVSAPADGS